LRLIPETTPHHFGLCGRLNYHQSSNSYVYEGSRSSSSSLFFITELDIHSPM
jgi:hypothetical protein